MAYAVDFSKGKPRMGKPIILKQTPQESTEEKVTPKEKRKVIAITDNDIKKRRVVFA